MNLGHLDDTYVDLGNPDEVVSNREVARSGIGCLDEGQHGVIGDREVIRYLRERTLDDIAAAAAAEAARLPTQAVLLDFSTVSSIDSAGVHALSETIPEALAKAAASAHLKPPRLFLVGARGPVRDRLRAGERAHASAHARPPGCAVPLLRAASVALQCGRRGAPTVPAAASQCRTSAAARASACVLPVSR
jgi:hypothetical protein